jgi:hypothetical protein
MDMFRVILDYVARHDLPVTTMRALATARAPSSSRGGDVVPRVTVAVDFHRYVWQAVRRAGWPVSMFAAGCFIAMAALLALAWRRGAKHRGPATPAAAASEAGAQ